MPPADYAPWLGETTTNLSLEETQQMKRRKGDGEKYARNTKNGNSKDPSGGARRRRCLQPKGVKEQRNRKKRTKYGNKDKKWK